LAMSAFNDEEFVWGMLASGAQGYLLKEEALEKVVCAVLAVASGEEWYSQGVMDKVIAFENDQSKVDRGKDE